MKLSGVGSTPTLGICQKKEAPMIRKWIHGKLNAFARKRYENKMLEYHTRLKSKNHTAIEFPFPVDYKMTPEEFGNHILYYLERDHRFISTYAMVHICGLAEAYFILYP